MKRAAPVAAAAVLAGLLSGAAPASEDYEAAREAFARHDARAGVSALRSAAHGGDARAQNDLGALYEDGRFVERDFGRAVFWYRKSAEQDHPEGQLNLGRMYRGGLGIERDERRAAYWYRAAAGQGVAAAQFFLGVMHESGRGVERDPVKSWLWFSLAADQGDEDARFRRDRLGAALGDEERASAEGALRGYREAKGGLGPEPSREDEGEGPAPAGTAAGASPSPPQPSAPAVRGDPLVFRIQGALADLGYDPGERDGDAGSRTRDAIRQFEIDHRFRPRGRLDERTLHRLRDALETGRPAASVIREIQTRLQQLGYSPGAVDGQAGPRTARAVEAFQRARGVSVDGRLSLDLLRLLRGVEG